MSDSKPSTTPGTDWTRLLSDPDLVGHLGQLLQTYREAAPERREEALLAAMREIKLLAATLTSAEMIKYAANAFLAMKIGFANEIANICERVGAEATEVMTGIGLDARIGSRFASR